METSHDNIQKILDFYSSFWKQEYNLDSILGKEAFDNEKFKIFSINIGDKFIGSGMFEKKSDIQYELRSIAIYKDFRLKNYGTNLIKNMEDFARK